MAMNQSRGTGRRKTSVARVRLIPGEKGIVINGKDMADYFGGREILSKIVEQPLALTETLDKYQVIVNVFGGGNAGQAGAIRHGVSRALVEADETLRAALKEAGFLTRDSRMVERKKYGRKKEAEKDKRAHTRLVFVITWNATHLPRRPFQPDRKSVV